MQYAGQTAPEGVEKPAGQCAAAPWALPAAKALHAVPNFIQRNVKRLWRFCAGAGCRPSMYQSCRRCHGCRSGRHIVAVMGSVHRDAVPGAAAECKMGAACADRPGMARRSPLSNKCHSAVNRTPLASPVPAWHVRRSDVATTGTSRSGVFAAQTARKRRLFIKSTSLRML